MNSSQNNTQFYHEKNESEHQSISQERVKDILIHHERIAAENEIQMERLKGEIVKLQEEKIPDGWIISETFPEKTFQRTGGSRRSEEEDCSGVLARYEDYVLRKMDEKYRQLEAKIRSAEAVSRVMCSYDVLPTKLRDVIRIIYLECGTYTLGMNEAMEQLGISASTAARRRKQGMETICRIYESDLETADIIHLTEDEVRRIFMKAH